MEVLLVIIGALAVLFFLLFYGIFAWGFVCFKFYHWFILPIFPISHELDYIQCVGIMFFISLFKNHGKDTYKEDEKKKKEALWSAMIMPWMFVLLGWLFTVIFM
jgi:hypothetical protein